MGWGDNLYLPNGDAATTNAQLVENVVKIAECMGRQVATPEETRQIVGTAGHIEAAQ